MNVHNVPVWHMEDVWKTNRFQEWWHNRWYSNEGSHSNIRIGDIFSLGKRNQFGIVYGKVCVCRAGHPDSEPPLFQYDIGGDIGGHWHRPDQNEIRRPYGGEGNDRFRFIPSATQLAELDEMTWARRLIDHYRAHPVANTHRGYLIVERNMQ